MTKISTYRVQFFVILVTNIVFYRKWVFEFKSPEEAEGALAAATEPQNNPKLGLLGLTGVCMDSSSPEPTSGSASGTNRA